MKMELSTEEVIVLKQALVERINSLRGLANDQSDPETAFVAAELGVKTFELYQRVNKEFVSSVAQEMADAYAEWDEEMDAEAEKEVEP